MSLPSFQQLVCVCFFSIISVRAINFATQRFISQIAYDAMQHAHTQISAAAAKDPQVFEYLIVLYSKWLESAFS
jgi:hypothetical protein